MHEVDQEIDTDLWRWTNKNWSEHNWWGKKYDDTLDMMKGYEADTDYKDEHKTLRHKQWMDKKMTHEYDMDHETETDIDVQ